MSFNPVCVSACVVLSLPLVAATVSCTNSAPPAEKLTVRLSNVVDVTGDELRFGHAALPDGESVIVVGSGDVRDDVSPDTAAPGGVIVNLKTKAVRRFTNGHTARINSVACSADGAQVVTGGSAHDGWVRVRDAKAGKPLTRFHLASLVSKSHLFKVAHFHLSNKVAVTLDSFIGILDPADREKRVDLEADYLSGTGPDELAISPDDKYVACSTFPNLQVVIWNVGTKKVLHAAALLPEGVGKQDFSKAIWAIRGLCFTRSGEQLIALRSGPGSDIPKGTPEEKVPAERWGLFLIDVLKQKTTPLGMGNPGGTLHFALHPSGDWLAAVGPGWSDKPIGGDPDAMTGEVRVYHYPTRTLVYKVQCDPDPESGFYPSWVGFTPDGKKLVAVSHPAKIRAWDFTPVKP